jgi:hypothetical protein
MFTASWSLCALIYRLLQIYAPSNLIIRRVRRRDGLRWGPCVGLAGVLTYGLLMVLAQGLLDDGAPGWVNLVFLVGFWNTIRFATLIPVSVGWLLRVRHQEKVMLRELQAEADCLVPTASVPRPAGLILTGGEQ